MRLAPQALAAALAPAAALVLATSCGPRPRQHTGPGAAVQPGGACRPVAAMSGQEKATLADEYGCVAELGIDPATLRRMPLRSHIGRERDRMLHAQFFGGRAVELEHVHTGQRFPVEQTVDDDGDLVLGGRVPCGRYRMYYSNQQVGGERDLPCNDGNMTDLKRHFQKNNEEWKKALDRACRERGGVRLHGKCVVD